MIKKIANKATFALVNHKVISGDDFTIYSFGIELFIFKAINSFVILAIGFFLKEFAATVVILLLFSVIRPYIGGYHASSRRSCFVYSVLLMTAAIVAFKFHMVYDCKVILVIAVLSSICIYCLAPSDTESKRLDKKEIVRYRTISLIVLGLMLAVTIIALFVYRPVAEMIALVFLLQTILLLLNHPYRKRCVW